MATRRVKCNSDIVVSSGESWNFLFEDLISGLLGMKAYSFVKYDSYLP